MSSYFDLSVRERGDRVRAAIDSIEHIGSYAIGHDGVIALENVDIYDDPEFPTYVGGEGKGFVMHTYLSAIIVRIVKDRAETIPRDFIGPLQVEADSVSATF